MRLKKRFPAFSWKALQNSLLLRLGGAIAAIALLAVVGMSVSGLVAESTQGSGEAINRAGSLRMQSWQMASLYLATPLPSDRDAGKRMAEAIRGFEDTLESEAIRAMLPRWGDDGLTRTYRAIEREWRERVRPPDSFPREPLRPGQGRGTSAKNDMGVEAAAN